MNSPGKYQLYASSLLTDLEGATASNLPRRQVLADWLCDFRDRAAQRSFRIDPAELADLTAINDHLAINQVAAMPRPTLA